MDTECQCQTGMTPGLNMRLKSAKTVAAMRHIRTGLFGNYVCIYNAR